MFLTFDGKNLAVLKSFNIIDMIKVPKKSKIDIRKTFGTGIVSSSQNASTILQLHGQVSLDIGNFVAIASTFSNAYEKNSVNIS